VETRQQRQYRSLEQKLTEGEVTREQLAANPSKSLFALGLSAHPESGLWIGEPAPSAQARVPPTPPPPPASSSQRKKPRTGERPDLVEAALSRRRFAEQEAERKAKEEAERKDKEEAERAAAEQKAEEEKAKRVPPAPPTPPKARGSIVKALVPGERVRAPPAQAPSPAPGSPGEEASPVSSPEPPHRARVACDFHGVLDVGLLSGGKVPESTVDAFQKLISQGFCPWVCSYIGQGGPRSAERRDECRRIVADLASQLGLAFPVDHISHKGLFLLIVPQKLWDPVNKSGKAVALRAHQTGILVDDRREVCNEAEDYGILPYQVLTQRRPKDKDIYKVSQDSFACGPLEHLFSESVAGAVREILSDDTSVHKGRCILDWKTEAVVANKVW